MHVLITGANGGLGEAVTQAFLDRGDRVTGIALSWNGKSPPILALEADMTSAGACARAVEQALATGPIEALIHVIGAFAGGTPVAGTDDETWDRMMNLNLRSAFLAFRAVLPGMLAAGRGRIVAIGSRTGMEPAAGLSAYGVSKAGLVALVRTLALELKGTGVTANVVMPSIIDTPANRRAIPGAKFSQWVKPESIANVLVWLASEPSADINGAVIPIYGNA
ncbi:MAG: SDR family NAD(P)-dependent oxidoreductase [Bryobacteraceae bacterium]